MNTAVSSIVSQLDLEQVELNLFRGQSENLGTPRVFGGQVIGQALVAALRTVSERHCHSLHGYFRGLEILTNQFLTRWIAFVMEKHY